MAAAAAAVVDTTTVVQVMEAHFLQVCWPQSLAQNTVRMEAHMEARMDMVAAAMVASMQQL